MTTPTARWCSMSMAVSACCGAMRRNKRPSRRSMPKCVPTPPPSAAHTAPIPRYDAERPGPRPRRHPCAGLGPRQTTGVIPGPQRRDGSGNTASAQPFRRVLFGRVVGELSQTSAVAELSHDGMEPLLPTAGKLSVPLRPHAVRLGGDRRDTRPHPLPLASIRCRAASRPRK